MAPAADACAAHSVTTQRSIRLGMKKAIKRRFPRATRAAVAILSPVYKAFILQRNPDRRVLEDVILPAMVADKGLRRILFVGCAWYTRKYDDRFPGREFATLDVDDRVARCGARRHIVAPMAAMIDHFEAASLEAVICNGVVGWGVNTREECDQAFNACHACLRPGGLLVVGWEAFRPPEVPLQDLVSLRAFRREALAPFPAWRYPTFNRLGHTFDFYCLPEPGSEAAVDPPREVTAHG